MAELWRVGLRKEWPERLKDETRWNKVEQDKLIQQIRVSKNREEVEDGWRERERDNGEVQNIPRLWAWHFFYQLDNLIISAYRYLPKVYIHTSPLSFLHIKTFVIYL